MFHSFRELEEYCTTNNIPLHEAFIRMEEKVSGMSRKSLIQRMREKLDVMRASIITALENPPKLIIP